MPLETELKLSLRPTDRRRLLAHPLLCAQPPERLRLRNTYFDTPALALMTQRIAVRERRIGRQTLLTVKTAGRSVGGLSQRGEWEGPTRPGAFDFAALVDDTAMAEALTALASQLVPVFRTDFLRRRWVIEHGGARVELALDQGTVSTGHNVDTPRSHRHQPLLELELELLNGPVNALFDLAHTLALGPPAEARRGLWLFPCTRSKAERGFDLFLDRRPEPSRAEALPWPPEASPVQAFAATALNSLNHLQANLLPWLNALETSLETAPETAAGKGTTVDPGFVHQAHVALRRLRTGLRLFAPHLPPGFSAHWDSRWKSAATPLGELRQWDVLATETLLRLLGEAAAQPEWQPLRDWIGTRRRAAHQAARAVWHRPEQALDLLAFTRAVLALPADSPAGHDPELSRRAHKTLHQQHTRLMGQAGEALTDSPDARHALRVKRWRDTLDVLDSRLTPDALARAQNTLRRLNDLSTAQTLLADCPLPEHGELLAHLDAELARRLRHLPRLERALRRSAAPG